jgi:hypothetical protein
MLLFGTTMPPSIMSARGVGVARDAAPAQCSLAIAKSVRVPPGLSHHGADGAGADAQAASNGIAARTANRGLIEALGITPATPFRRPKELWRAPRLNGGTMPASIEDHIEEKTMGLFERFKTRAGTPVPTTGEYLPAGNGGTTMDVVKGQAGAVLDRATQVYKQNPKLVAGLGLLALASVLVSVKKGRTSFR